jgi:hypothetical protein
MNIYFDFKNLGLLKLMFEFKFFYEVLQNPMSRFPY